MIDFIVKYWVEFLFGLVVSGMGIFFKRHMTLLKKEQAAEKKDFLDLIKKEIGIEFNKALDNDKSLQSQINIMNNQFSNLLKGILSIQRRTFEEDCRKLLDENHDITIDEYEQITEDHDVYNSLGGNHNGDKLYDLVKKKVESNFTHE